MEKHRYPVTTVLVDWANSPHENPHLDKVQNLNQPLDFPDDEFATVLLSDVLEHIRDPRRLVGELARVVQPSGVVLLNVPFLVGLHEQPHDYFRYTRFALTQLASEAGFSVEYLEPIAGGPDVILELVSKFIFRVPVLGVLVSSVLQTLGSWILDLSIMRPLSTRSAESWPLGYAMIARRNTD